MKHKIKNWIEEKAHQTNAKVWLFFLSFTDASFSPIPPDLLLAPMLASRETRKRWWEYSGITFIASIFGAVFGYFIGYTLFSLFGDTLISFYGLEEEVLIISREFSKNAFWAIFAGAFTPLPFKLFTISAGLFKINFLTFLFASIVGRFVRYFFLGIFMKVFGERLSSLVFKYFKTVTIFVLFIIFVLLLT